MDEHREEGEAAEHGGEPEAAYDERLRRCMVQVEVDVPLVALADGVHSSSFAGTEQGSNSVVRVWEIAATAAVLRALGAGVLCRHATPRVVGVLHGLQGSCHQPIMVVSAIDDGHVSPSRQLLHMADLTCRLVRAPA